MPSPRVDQTSVPGVLRDHRARIRALEALNPAFMAADLPFAFTAGEVRTSVPDSTLTPVTGNGGFVSDNGSSVFDVSDVVADGVISVLQDGFYLAFGYLVWNTTPSDYLTYCSIEFSPSGTSLDLGTGAKLPTVGSTTLASQPDPSTVQQIITLLNLQGAPPYSVSLNAFQASGSTQATLDEALTLVRFGSAVVTS